LHSRPKGGIWHLGFFAEFNSVWILALFPGPHPAFRRLQLAHGRAWERG